MFIHSFIRYTNSIVYINQLVYTLVYTSVLYACIYFSTVCLYTLQYCILVYIYFSTVYMYILQYCSIYSCDTHKYSSYIDIHVYYYSLLPQLTTIVPTIIPTIPHIYTLYTLTICHVLDTTYNTTL